MSKQIQLWLDATSDPDGPRYCVSLCDGDGEEIRCLSTFTTEDKADAWSLAKDEAQRREIPAVEIDEHGQEVARYELV